MKQKHITKFAEKLVCAAVTFWLGLFAAVIINAQTTEFTYQGRLADGGQTANGNYDLEFKLFDAEAGGTEIGTLQRLNVTVANGIFSVKLDFGANFNGQPRFLEIAVRPAGSTSSFAILTPRQPFTSTPYAIQSLNTIQLGGVNANQFVLTNDPRMTNARNPLAGSTNYIQNTTARQENSNFNISGNGTSGGTLSANIVNAATQYNLGGGQVLRATNTSLFVGPGAGASVTTGFFNNFIGNSAGFSTTTGNFNTFAGISSGLANTTGNNNSFFGNQSGFENSTGSNNAFFGRHAGINNTTGSNNTFIGLQSGFANTTGSNNTTLGTNANVTVSDLNFATAIGAGAFVFTSNTVVLGRSSDTVRIPGSFVIEMVGAGGNQTLCRNAANQFSFCSSSLRYKTNIIPFNSGLSLVQRLRPITFDWKADGTHDLGLVAEEVAEIEPLLVTRNEKGEIEGVKYDRVAVVLLNAVKEQQTQINAQQKLIQQQQTTIDGLKKLVCGQNPNADVCKEEQK